MKITAHRTDKNSYHEARINSFLAVTMFNRNCRI